MSLCSLPGFRCSLQSSSIETWLEAPSAVSEGVAVVQAVRARLTSLRKNGPDGVTAITGRCSVGPTPWQPPR